MALSSSAVMQSLLASSGSDLTSRLRLSPVILSSGLASHGMQRIVGLKIRCMAEDEVKQEEVTTPSVPPRQLSSPIPKVSANFTDVFAFSGPAPERINGRLAMIGFVAAIAVELARGSDLFVQISEGGAQWFLGTSILLSVASLVPLFKGVRAEGKGGFMNSNAELWNGRIAMLGLVALAFTCTKC